MKKDKLYFPILITILGIVCFHYNVKGQDGVKWSGTVSFYEKTTGTEGLLREWRMDAMITNDTGTAYHTSRWSSDKGSGSCNNQGKSELDVGIDDEKRTYSIMAHVPGCSGTQTINGVESVYPVTDETGIAINDQPLGTNRNVLSGRTVTTDRFEDGTITTIYTWNLRRGPIDVELIVTPQNYDSWMPEPGDDGIETTLGNKMTVLLRLQKRGGGKPGVKAKFFDLRLNATSNEYGTTINFPLSPKLPGRPDLSFLEQEDAILSGKDQFIRIPVEDGINGYVEIGSFDGGGYSDLTAVAILESGDSIKGNLIRTGGITEIPIPKRNAGSNIALAWLQANRRTNRIPADMDDKDTSKGNANIGDGLTAYEEYRGVISETKFMRLDPVKKELGIRVQWSELSLFEEGIGWFESASGIDVIPFYTFEVDEDRWLNHNGDYGYLAAQYVLKLSNGFADSAFGVMVPLSTPWIPKNVKEIIIDVERIKRRFQSATLQKTRIARTTAHELAHGVDVDHHGDSTDVPNVTATKGRPRYLIFNENGVRINRRNYPLEYISRPQNEESGDVSCFIAYLNTSLWSFTGTHLDSLVHYEVPDIPVGNILCTSNKGTGINHFSNIGINNVNKYFGDAPRGNCLNRLRLK